MQPAAREGYGEHYGEHNDDDETGRRGSGCHGGCSGNDKRLRADPERGGDTRRACGRTGSSANRAAAHRTARSCGGPARAAGCSAIDAYPAGGVDDPGSRSATGSSDRGPGSCGRPASHWASARSRSN